VNLKSMSLDKLILLKSRVDAVLVGKVAHERRTLESELANLTRFDASPSRRKFANGRRAGGKVAPKYRNPKNPTETWAGRGLKPRWLMAAIKSGKKLEHFSIAAVAKTGPAKKSRRAGKK
jgi:DNA-binding protein H-NS